MRIALIVQPDVIETKQFPPTGGSMTYGVVLSISGNKITFDGEDGKSQTRILKAAAGSEVTAGTFVSMETDGNVVTSIALSECSAEGRKCPTGYKCVNHRCVKA
jgi:hypothetical protein